MSAHGQLADALKPLVPAAWRIVGVERDLDELEAGVVTVVIKLESIARIDAAPNTGRYWAGWTVTVVQPNADPELADPAIYDACLELVAALDELDWLRWTRAQKVLEAGRYAFDITLETITTPREDTPNA
jgi:hypothetical protein